MILLSFTSAAKYVLSMMLAVLGIIPFEEIETSQQKPETQELTFMDMERPLKLNDGNTFSGEPFFTSYNMDDTNPAFIPSRNDFEIEMDITSEMKGYEYVQCTVTKENLATEKEFMQIIILHKDLETEDKKELVYLVNTNI